MKSSDGGLGQPGIHELILVPTWNWLIKFIGSFMLLCKPGT